MKNIIVLGAGMVGSTIAIDLSKKHHITLTDYNQEALQKAKQKCNDLSIQLLDVTDKNTLQQTIKKFDLVVCAVPGFLGFEALKSIIEAEMDVIDISFFSKFLRIRHFSQRKKYNSNSRLWCSSRNG